MLKSVASRSLRKKKNRIKRMERLANILEQLVGAVMTLADAIRNHTQSSTIVDLKDFKKFVGNDRKFSGTDNPIVAEKWLMGIEKEFDALKIPEENKVRFATYMLEGEAEHWWRSIKRMHDVNNMCWQKFEEFFLAKYFSPTVTQLDRKFSEIGPHLAAIEELRARELEDALRPSIHDRVVGLQHPTYAKVLGSAVAIDASTIKAQKEREQSEPKKRDRKTSSSPRKRRHTEHPRSGWITNKEKGKGCWRCERDHFMRDCPVPAPPELQVENQPCQPGTQRQNFHGKQPFQLRDNVPSFQ